MQNYDPAAMDAAAESARLDLLAKLSEQDEPTRAAFISLAEWFYNWYMTAGHKRLGRLLVQLFREQENDR